jgi:autotransporter family porin
MALASGCNDITLTWPEGTPLSTIAASIARPDALKSIWHRDAAGGFEVYTASPGVPSEYGATTTSPERVSVCMKAPSVLNRPVGADMAAHPAPALAAVHGSAPAPSPAAIVPVVPRPPDLMPLATPAAPAAAPTTAAPEEPPPDEHPLHFTTLPAGTRLRTGEQCAGMVRRSDWEPRPRNTDANQTRGTKLANVPAGDPMSTSRYESWVDGDFTGTTDEILQWGACKWGLDEDIVRAIAMVESWWNQDAAGDHNTTFGILQIKRTTHEGTYPLSLNSTAFNVDYALAWWRTCVEGGFSNWLTATRGDTWGCIGAWYSGGWWDNDAVFYVQVVRQRLAEQGWLRPGF